MEDFNAVEILIVEDNPRDAELTLRALKKNNLANNILVAQDGAEALDFFFCRGKLQKEVLPILRRWFFLILNSPK